MVNSVVEVPSRPIAEAAPKKDEQTDSGSFMSMLAGMVSQPGPSNKTAQSSESTDAASSSKAADQAATPLTTAALAGKESGEQGKASADDTQVVQSQVTEQVQPELVDVAKAKQTETLTQVATTELPGQEVKTEAKVSQMAASTLASPIATDKTDRKLENDKKGVVGALESLTRVRGEAKTLPEAAKPAGEMAATLVANRLNLMGQNSQSGAVLLNTDGQSQTKEASSDGPAKNIVAAAMAGSKKPEQAPVDAGTRVQVEWKPTEPVTISASSNGGFQDNLQFANGNTRQSETKDISTGNSNAQAFGVEMKTQLGTDTIIRQAQSVPAQAPQTDPTLGEKMVGQIVREVTLHKLGENTTLSIRLDPPELGTLKISVTSQAGVMTTQIESPNAVVRGILETHLAALKDALANAGVEVSKFSVSAGLDFGQNAHRQQQSWQPTRMAPATEFNPLMQDQQSVIEAAASGNQTSTASYSWLA